MKRSSSGLHKDVPAIFDGVWNPALDNYQEPLEPQTQNEVVSVEAQAQFDDDSSRESSLGGLSNTCREVLGFIFRTRARRERKRLHAISKHLIINMES